MRTVTHLVSMPCANPAYTPIQVAVLKAWIDRQLGGQVPVKTYSAFYAVCAELAGTAVPKALETYWATHFAYHEYLYWLLYLDDWVEPSPLAGHSDRLLDGLNRARRAADMLDQTSTTPLTHRFLDRVRTATQGYLDRQLVAAIKPDAINVVGFSLQFHQVYSSLYGLRYLQQQLPGAPLLLLLGGAAVHYPELHRLLQRLGVAAIAVLGEGEGKLEQILRLCLDRRSFRHDRLLEEIAGSVAGTYATLDDSYDLLASTSEDLEYCQLRTLADLPHPDYREYFSLIRNHSAGEEQAVANQQATAITLEGSRGCFARCDFCSLLPFSGFRRQEPAAVLAAVTEQRSRLDGHRRFRFADTVCDTWIEPFLDSLLASGEHLVIDFVSLRSHHAEPFWVKLAQAGISHVQVGLEALAPRLLRQMNKGTHCYQNLYVMKVLRELGILISSNIIVYHPKSTVEDVAETRRTLELITHLQPPSLSSFFLSLHSPLYDQLGRQDRAALEPWMWFDPPPEHRPLLISPFYRPPARLSLDRQVREAWDRFVSWYLEHRATLAEHPPCLRVTAVDAAIDRVVDSRDGEEVTYCLDPDETAVYRWCHQPLDEDRLGRLTGFSEARLRQVLARLGERRLLILLEQRYLSLALRPSRLLKSSYPPASPR